jgi:hypothetical protein
MPMVAVTTSTTASNGSAGPLTSARPRL